MKKTFVEFYFPGTDLAGKCEREVSSRDVELITSIPENAISCRFFSKDENQNKFDFSPYYFFGTEYSAEEFKIKYPQMTTTADPNLAVAKRIVKATTGGLYPLSDEDIVISV